MRSFPYRLAQRIFRISISPQSNRHCNRYYQLYPDISRTIFFDFDLRFIFPDSMRKVCKIVFPSRFNGIRQREEKEKKKRKREKEGEQSLRLIRNLLRVRCFCCCVLWHAACKQFHVVMENNKGGKLGQSSRRKEKHQHKRQQ